MIFLFHWLLKEHASWPLIDVLAEAAALKFHNQVIREFTRRKIESTHMAEPVVTAASVNRHPAKSPLEKVRSFFFSKKQFLWALTSSHKKLGRHWIILPPFLQPKNARLCYKVLGAKNRKKNG